MTTIAFIFALLIVYQLKHILADYVLQTEYHLGKFKPGWDFLGPLTSHAAVHATMTAIIAIWTISYSVPFAIVLVLASFDFLVHFLMDRIKAGPKYLGRFKALSGPEYVDAKRVAFCKPHDLHPNGKPVTFDEVCEACDRLHRNKLFWWSLGFDQCIHHLTHYAIIAALVFFRG